jgi:hypothetical protein
MRAFVFLFSIVLFFSCRESSKIPDDFDYGKTENGVYTNNYFGMEVTVPPGWAIQSKKQVDSLFNKEYKTLEEKNKEFVSRMKENADKTATLLVVFKYRPDSAIIGYNPYLFITAEKINPSSGVNNGIDYLNVIRNQVEKAKIGYHVTSEYSVRNIGNKNFDVLRFTRAVGEQMDVQRLYHVRIEKEYALNIMISYASSKQEEELLEVLRQINFR